MLFTQLNGNIYNKLREFFELHKNNSVINHFKFIEDIINFLKPYNLDISIEQLNDLDEFGLFIYCIFDFASKNSIKKVYNLSYLQNPHTDIIGNLITHIYYNSHLLYNKKSRDNIEYTLYLIEKNLAYILDINKIHNRLLLTLYLYHLQSFYLCYFGNNLKNINILLHKLRVKYLYASQMNQINHMDQINKKSTKLKIGIISNNIISGNNQKHVMEIWYLSIIKNLDNRFIKILVTPLKNIKQSHRDIFDDIIVLDVRHNMLVNYKNTIDTLKKSNFDIIYYPSIGMYNIHSILADHRLANVQFMSGGHPITSGSSAIDEILIPKGYVKSSEISILQKSFTETINTIIPVNYIEKTHFKENLIYNRDELHMNDNIFYITCFQKLHKVTNDMFEILNYILKNTNSNIHIILHQNIKSNILENIHFQYHNRLLLFETQYHNIYMSIINASDIILDSFPFNGSTTTFEALSLNKIVIGLGSQYKRPNDFYLPEIWLEGTYNNLCMYGLVVSTKKDLVNIINVLYYNKNEKNRIEQLLIKNTDKLFNNKMAFKIYNNEFINIYKKYYNYIFNISNCKTGTTSLEYLFTNSFKFNLFNYVKLFYRDKSFVYDVFVNRKYDKLFELIENGDSTFFSDCPFNFKKTYEVLDKTYPNARFILCIRDTKSWIDSLKKWLIMINKLLKNKIEYYCCDLWVKYAFKDTINDKWEIINEHLLACIYNKYHEDIINYFANTNKLCVYKLEDSQDTIITKLCNFMDIKNANYVFPHKNPITKFQ